MKVFEGYNIWDFYDKKNHWVVIPTNGIVKKKTYTAVMGAGLAKEAAVRFPDLPKVLGTEITLTGNHVYCIPRYRLISFPTKEHWKDDSDIDLIKRSAEELEDMLVRGTHISLNHLDKKDKVVAPKFGCGKGGLTWSRVRRIIEKHFDVIGENNIAIVDKT